MSQNLYIEPETRKKTSLSDTLKYALRKRNNGKNTYSYVVDEYDVSYFKGLRDADIEDAQIVLDMIEKYGACIISEE